MNQEGSWARFESDAHPEGCELRSLRPPQRRTNQIWIRAGSVLTAGESRAGPKGHGDRNTRSPLDIFRDIFRDKIPISPWNC
jgi:hypothetical protein